MGGRFDDLGDRRSFADRQQHIALFSFDTPFTPHGKAHGATHEQWKRRTIVSVAHEFPYIVKRQKIVSKREIVLSPIECVLEDVRKRVDRVRKEINPASGPPSLKTLNQVLSGSINMQVHGGAEEVCATFLHPDKVAQHDPAYVSQLRDELAGFFEVCYDGLKTAAKLVVEEADKPLQELLESGYKILLGKCQDMIYTDG